MLNRTTDERAIIRERCCAGTLEGGMKLQCDQAGYAIVPDVIASLQLDSLGDALSAAADRTRAGARHLMKNSSAIARLARDPRLVALASEILGDAAHPFKATFFDKSPASNWLVGWHQDTALPLAVRQEKDGWGPWSIKAGVEYAHAPASALQRVIALRIHLDDSAAANGPLRVLPGTHTLGVLTDDGIAELRDTITPVDCLVPRGGVIAMRPLTVHASSKSKRGSAAPSDSH